MWRFTIYALLLGAGLSADLAMAQIQGTPTSIIGPTIPVLRQDEGWSYMDAVRWLIVLFLLVLAAFVAWRIRRTGSPGLASLLRREEQRMKVIHQQRVDGNLTVYLIEVDNRQLLIAAGQTGLMQIDPRLSLPSTPVELTRPASPL